MIDIHRVGIIALISGLQTCLLLFILQLIMKYRHLFISQKGREFLDMGSHATKHTTPTMGGLSFFVLIPSTLYLYYNFKKAIFICLAAGLSGLIGAIDDWYKLRHGKGLSVKLKFILQAFAALIPGIYYFFIFHSTKAFINFFGVSINCEWLIIGWIAWVIMSTTHAVNLTDGVDGLAITSSCITIIFFTIVTTHLKLDGIIFWYPLFLFFTSFNIHPAKIFMGDVGAFFLGGYIAGLFLVEKIELLLPLAGITFVWSTLSVILQYLSYKIRKKKLFLFAPYHHALEKKGYSEKQICKIYSIAQIFGFILAGYFKKAYF